MDKGAAARFRGNANNSNCSARYLNANNAVSNANRNNAGSAKVTVFYIKCRKTHRSLACGM